MRWTSVVSTHIADILSKEPILNYVFRQRSSLLQKHNLFQLLSLNLWKITKITEVDNQKQYFCAAKAIPKELLEEMQRLYTFKYALLKHNFTALQISCFRKLKSKFRQEAERSNRDNISCISYLIQFQIPLSKLDEQLRKSVAIWKLAATPLWAFFAKM